MVSNNEELYLKFDELEYKSYLENLYSLEQNYKKNKNIYLYRKKNRILKKFVLVSSLMLFVIFYTIYMILKNKSFLYEVSNIRAYGILVSLIMGVPVIINFISSLKKLIGIYKNPEYNIREFISFNEAHLREISRCKKTVTTALTNGDFVELPVIKTTLEEDDYKYRFISKFGVIYFTLMLIIQCIFLFTQNSLIYDCALKNVKSFDENSSERIEWCFKRLPNNYKDIRSIREDYRIVEEYIHILDEHTDAVRLIDLTDYMKGLSDDAPGFSKEAVQNFWNLQEESKKLEHEWNFTPLLDSINLMYLVEGKKMVSADHQYLYLTTDSFSDKGYLYTFNSGTLRVYMHHPDYIGIVHAGWFEVFALNDFKMISETTATVQLYTEYSEQLIDLYIYYS